MSEILYPVVGDAPPCRTSVWSSDGEEICNCRTEGTAADCEARALRIAAALNATRHLTVEQIECLCPESLAETTENLSPFNTSNSGSAARGE